MKKPQGAYKIKVGDLVRFIPNKGLYLQNKIGIIIKASPMECKIFCLNKFWYIYINNDRSTEVFVILKN